MVFIFQIFIVSCRLFFFLPPVFLTVTRLVKKPAPSQSFTASTKLLLKLLDWLIDLKKKTLITSHTHTHTNLLSLLLDVGFLD